MYQAILFDLDDTLFSLRGCEAQALQRTLSEAWLLDRLPANYAEGYAASSSGYWAARTVKGEAQYTREDVLALSWRDFLAQHELDAALAAGLAEQFWAEFCRATALNPGAEAVLRRLSAVYRLGMITNGYSDSQRGRLAAAGLLPMLELVLISEEVGVAKPDSRIFEAALSKLGLPADAVLYVGDSLAHDYQGCLAAGIDFCHYCPSPRDDMELPPVKFRISRLDELPDLLSLVA